MFELMREIYSITETLFSKTGQFGARRTVQPAQEAIRVAIPRTGWKAETQFFIGTMVEDAFVERLAAD